MKICIILELQIQDFCLHNYIIVILLYIFYREKKLYENLYDFKIINIRFLFT